MMSQPAKYEPADAVVAPAFREVLDRLRRSRMANPKPAEISADERKAFEYGVQQRKRVLEHALFLVFGQWAVYRQGVSRLKSRGLNIAYGVSSVFMTSAFVQKRAGEVSKDMFGHIVTTGIDSALANEARIVLAELEGPDGPYFKRVCRERGFNEDLSVAVAGFEQETDPVQDLHPQLRLRPRLLMDDGHPPIQVVKRGRDNQLDSNRRGVPPNLRMEEERRRRNIPWKVNQSNSSDYNKPNRQSPTDAEFGGPSRESESFTSYEELERVQRVDKTRERQSSRPAEDDNGNMWGKPFDFANAAEVQNEFNSSDDVSSNNASFPEDNVNLTPSQQRAAARRRRRIEARASRDDRSAKHPEYTAGGDDWRDDTR